VRFSRSRWPSVAPWRSPTRTGERDRLTETLAAWLAHQRHTPAIAHELHVHPQTVRYRVAKLRQLLGDGMDTGQGRFELELALRVSAV
jgi:DNA-binding PucR family transcriptional regulator